MSDYIPVDVVIGILKRLPVKSLLKCRSVSKTWRSLICDPSFVSAHLQASLSRPPENTPFFLLGCMKKGREKLSLHYDNDGFDKFKQLPFPPFGYVAESPVVGSCNGLICIQLGYRDYDLEFVLWNPSIQDYLSLPQVSICEVECFNAGFGFDSRTNDYKLLIVGIDKDDSWIQPYLFSLNGNSWKRVTAIPPNYAFGYETALPFVSGAIHWLGFQERNNDEYSHVILGFDLSAETLLVINLPESLIGFHPIDLSIMKYGASSIALSIDTYQGELHELWVMKKYAVVETWTKVLILHRVTRFAWFPRVMGFRKNGEALLRVGKVNMATIDLNSQQLGVGTSLYLNCEEIELQGVEVGDLLSVHSYVESLLLLDQTVKVPSESAVHHSIDSSDLEELSGGESFVESLLLLDKAVKVLSKHDVNHPINLHDSDESSGGESDVA